MKIRFFSVVVFLLATFASKADTIDYWHVYYNDVIFGKFHQGQMDNELKIQKKEIRKNDFLVVKHHDDTPWHNTKIALVITNEKGITVKTISAIGEGSDLKVELKDLLKDEINKSVKLFFDYYEDNELRRRLFTLKIV
jgi:hypothetical protein